MIHSPGGFEAFPIYYLYLLSVYTRGWVALFFFHQNVDKNWGCQSTSSRTGSRLWRISSPGEYPGLGHRPDQDRKIIFPDISIIGNHLHQHYRFTHRVKAFDPHCLHLSCIIWFTTKYYHFEMILGLEWLAVFKCPSTKISPALDK